MQQITTFERPDLEIGTPSSRSVSLLNNNEQFKDHHQVHLIFAFSIRTWVPRMQLYREISRAALWSKSTAFLVGSVELLPQLALSDLRRACGAHIAGCYSNLFPLAASRGEKRVLLIFLWESCGCQHAHPPPRAPQCTHTWRALSRLLSLALTTSGLLYLFCLCVMRVQPRSIQSIS